MEAYSLGALVVPAVNGSLRALGYDVEALGLKALGLVIETRAQKSLVNFPELNITLWMKHDEIVDVEQRALAGDEEFKALLPNFDSGAEEPKECIFWIWKICKMLPVKFVLGMESGDLIEVWDQEDHPLDHYYSGPVDIPVTYLGLGVEEFFPKLWQEVEKFLGPRLVLSRLLPSGMHKLEIALYLRH